MRIEVLLVDDEESFTSALAERLALRGIRARTALNGEEALARIESSPPQVVLLDVMMPGLSGLEVLKRIKTLAPKVQVILLTGFGSVKHAMEGMSIGAFDYMEKPVDVDVLVEKIREASRAGRRSMKDRDR